MRPCVHLNNGTPPTCSIGFPLKCSTCVMYQLPSRRSSQQAQVIKEEQYTPKQEENVIHTTTVNNGVEQKILKTSAVTGGCGCKRG